MWRVARISSHYHGEAGDVHHWWQYVCTVGSVRPYRILVETTRRRELYYMQCINWSVLAILLMLVLVLVEEEEEALGERSHCL